MSMTPASSQYFEQVAGEWDTIRAGYFGEEVRQAAFTKAYLLPEMTVADVGAGTGYIAAGLAPLVQKVYALDGSAAMLDVARKNLAGFQNVEYRVSDGQSLALPDESVDAAFANMYLHHCPDPLSAIREMVRILKPGGRLVITDMDAHEYTWMKAEMTDVWQGFERSQVRAWLKEAGLVNIIVDCSGQCCSAESNTAAQDGEKAAPVQVSVFVATGTRRVHMRERVESAYSAAAQGGCGCGSPSESTASEAAAENTTSCCASSEASATSSSSCCGSPVVVPTQDSIYAGIYSPQELASIPPEAGEISLGCGNPIALAGLKPGEVVVDIGSGGGIDAFLAAKKVGEAGKVIGVDMTPAMLARARRTARKNGLTNVEFRQGQAEALPVEDGSVDVILSNCVINLTEDKGQVFREAFRILKPGGRLEVSDVLASQGLLLEARQDAGEWAGCISGALPEQEYLDLIAQAGFQNVTVRRSKLAEEYADVKFYSAIVSARKAAEDASTEQSHCGCGSSSCCG